MATTQKILKVRISYHYSIKEFFNLTINKSIIFLSLFLFSCSNYLVQAEIVKPEKLKCGSTSNAILLENSGKFTSNSDIFNNKLSLLDENINKDLFNFLYISNPKGSGGYNLKLTKIITNGNLHKIYFEEIKPAEGSKNIAVMTSTYCLMKINALDKSEVIVK